MREEIVNRIGWFASFMAVVMFASYIDQIRLNINGSPGSFILPLTTTMNCLSWILYAYLKPKIDWPILFCNALGAVVGIITATTAIIYN